jgi:cellobiose phosphorylase
MTNGNFGGFDADACEYVIRNPFTPRPWHNYLFNEEYLVNIGPMTAMTPGFYENGSVYVHGNCFWIHALARAGFGQDAWDALRAILPDTPNKPNADTEPFVVPNFHIEPRLPRGWTSGRMERHFRGDVYEVVLPE